MNEFVKARKIKLIEMNLTQLEIAKAIRVSPQVINREIKGEGISKRIRQEICEMTKTKPEEFFPESYGGDR